MGSEVKMYVGWLVAIALIVLGSVAPAAARPAPDAETVPYTLCQDAPQWSRPTDAVQQAHLDAQVRLRGADWSRLKERLKGIHIEIDERAPGNFRDFLDVTGLWDAEELRDTPECAITIAGTVEIWLLYKKLERVERLEQGDIALIIVPRSRGFQVVHLPMDALAGEGEHFTIHFRSPEGDALQPPIGWTRAGPRDPAVVASPEVAPAWGWWVAGAAGWLLLLLAVAGWLARRLPGRP